MYSNVYSFFGADSKVGTTMLVSSIAEVLSENNSVLVLNANKRLGLDYIRSGKTNTLDEILNKVSSNILEYQDLERIIIDNNDYHIIAGMSDLEKCRHFQPEYINRILDCLEDKYDVILIDAGSDLEFSGLAIGSLKCTNNSILVATQQEKTWNEIENFTPIFMRMGMKFTHTIVNKMQPKNSGVRDAETIGESISSLGLMATVSNSPYSWQSETDYKTLSNFDSSFKRDIQEVSRSIAMNMNLKFNDDRKGRLSWFNKK